MTQPTETVSQRAREAAARLMNSNSLAILLESGGDDGHRYVQAFARFEREVATNKDETIAKMEDALRTAEDALRDHACHAGPNVPCLRTKQQCRDECGRSAGDALQVVLSALASTKKEG